jgi:hypothetical protein
MELDFTIIVDAPFGPYKTGSKNNEPENYDHPSVFFAGINIAHNHEQQS